MGDSPGVILSLSKLRKRFSVQFDDEKNVFGFISRSGEEVEFRATESDSGVYTIVKGNFDLLKGTETVGESDEISCLDLAQIWAESEDLPQGDEAKFWCYFAGVERLGERSKDSVVKRAWWLHFLLGNPSVPVMKRLIDTKKILGNLTSMKMTSNGQKWRTVECAKRPKVERFITFNDRFALLMGLGNTSTLTLPMCFRCDF